MPEDAEFAEVQRLCALPPVLAAAPLRQAILRAQMRQQPWHLAFAQIGLAQAQCAADPVAALELARMALDATRALGSMRGQALALGVIALASRARGELADCLAALDQALQIERALHNAPGMVRVLVNLSTPLERVGRREAALNCLDEALELVPDAHDPRRARILTNIAAALASWARHDRDEGLPPTQWRPRAQRAVHVARRLIAQPEADLVAAVTNANYPRGCLAKALVALDELAEALPLLQSLRPIYAAQGDNYAMFYVELELARCWLQAGQPAQAAELARQSIALAQERRFEHFIDDLYKVLSQACEAAGDFRGALQAFQTYHRLKLREAVDTAEDRARSLAVRLDVARAQRESRSDTLTGLLNRRGFDEALHTAVAHAGYDQPVSLVVIDVDHFKAVNDRDGHQRGDQALSMVGKTLQRCCRVRDTAARIGGDEFALLGLMDAAVAMQIADRLRDALRADSQTRWADRDPLTLSIGIATTYSAVAPDRLMELADSALYKAKSAGRDTVRID